MEYGRKPLETNHIALEIRRMFHNPELGKFDAKEIYLSSYESIVDGSSPAVFFGQCGGKFFSLDVYWEERLKDIDSFSRDVIEPYIQFFDSPIDFGVLCPPLKNSAGIVRIVSVR